MCPHTTNLRSCVAAQILKHLWEQRVDQQFGLALVGAGCWVYMVALFRVATYIQAVILATRAPACVLWSLRDCIYLQLTLSFPPPPSLHRQGGVSYTCEVSALVQCLAGLGKVASQLAPPH